MPIRRLTGVSRTPTASRLMMMMMMMIALLFLLHPSPSSAFYNPLPRHSGPWRSLTIDELPIHSSPLTLLNPVELNGTLLYSHTAVAGPMFITNNPDDGDDIPVRFLLPHSLDDSRACRPLTHSMSDEGDSLIGGFLLIERGAGCSFTDKVNNVEALFAGQNASVAAIVLFGCTSGACTLHDELLSPAAFSPFSVPVIYIATADGQALKSYLLARRESYTTLFVDGVFVEPTACAGRVFNSSAAASAAGCPLPQPTGSLVGTGALTEPSELAALTLLASSLAFDPSYPGDYTFLRPWSDLLPGGSGLDPCLSRLVGLWCHRGRVTAIDLTQTGVTGNIPEGGLALPKLEFLLLLSDGITGPMPTDLCDLDQLMAIQIDGNSFTSLPDCIGGGTFTSTGEPSTSRTYSGLRSLLSLAGANNRLSHLPPSIGRLGDTLLVLAFRQNQMVGPLPAEVFQLKWLMRLELYGNGGLTFDFDANPNVSFGSMTQLFSVLLQSCALSGTTPPALFDGCVALSTVDLSNNLLSGSLPHFSACRSLTTLTLANNRFTGSLPTQWTQSFNATLLSLNMQHNQLDGVFNGLASFTALQYLLLSHNNLSSSIPADVGQSVWLMIGPVLQVLYLDHNNFVGPWSTSNWITNSIRTINMAYNGITNLPNDLWQSHVIDVDFSFNQLTGDLPNSSPSSSYDAASGQPAVTRFNIEGNPLLVSWPLPSWLHFASDPVQWHLSADGQFQCIVLVSTSDLLSVTVDPEFTAFNGCRCVRGFFGSPPTCALLPQSATITPYTPPESEEVGSEFMTIIGFNISATAAFNLTRNVTTVVPFVDHPLPFSDSWYGADRFTSGMATRFTIDLTDLRTDQAQNDETTQQNADNSGNPSKEIRVIRIGDDAAPSTPQDTLTLHPVRTLTVRVHLSRSNFTQDCSLAIYDSDASLDGNRVYSLSGRDSAALSALPASSAYTSTSSYRSAYGGHLASLSDAVLIEVSVFAAHATLTFDGRQPGGVTFIATYSYSFECPNGFVIPEPEEQTNGAKAATPTCVVPTIGTPKSVLILTLGIGGAIFLFAFSWLIYERYQRHKVLASQSLAGAGAGGGADSATHSEEDLESELVRLFAAFQSDSQRGIVKELMFDSLSLVWEVISTGLNWYVVGSSLARGTSELTSLNIGYIAVVVISTFAFGANCVTRIFQLITVKKIIDEERRTRHTSQTTDRESQIKAIAPIDDDMQHTHVKEDESTIRARIVSIERQLTRFGMSILSLLLNTIPFIILNLVTLYESDSHSSRDLVITEVSVLVACVIIGNRIQEARDYPKQRLRLARAQMEIVQRKQEKLYPNRASIHARPNNQPTTQSPSYDARPPAGTLSPPAVPPPPPLDDCADLTVSPLALRQSMSVASRQASGVHMEMTPRRPKSELDTEDDN